MSWINEKDIGYKPITTVSFNDMTKNYLEKIESPDVENEVVNIKDGPSSIETFYNEAFALPEILKTIDEYKSKCDVIVINCFADSAVNAARKFTDVPVAGPAEASMMIAFMLGHKFAVISIFINSGVWI